MWILSTLIIVFTIILGYLISTMKSSAGDFSIPKNILTILEFLNSRLVSILFIVLLIFAILIVIHYYKVEMNPTLSTKLQNVVLVETLTTNKPEVVPSLNPNTTSALLMDELSPLSIEPSIAFCATFEEDAAKREDQCNTLTKGNCAKTDCCGYLNQTTCVAGNKLGPIFKTNKKKHIQINNYEHQGVNIMDVS